jgi:putative lipoic acid-binding regulatory protein
MSPLGGGHKDATVPDNEKSPVANGKSRGEFEAEERRLIEAMENAHEFPGYYPVVLIARRGLGFEAELNATLAATQGDDPFRIRERTSRQGNYVSYHVDVFVQSAHDALARKQVLAEMPGVIVML